MFIIVYKPLYCVSSYFILQYISYIFCFKNYTMSDNAFVLINDEVVATEAPDVATEVAEI